ncbi:MAG: lytic murein transglycosylase B [Pseudomonadota bacterium]
MIRRVLVASLFLTLPFTAFALDTKRPDIAAFIDEMVAEHDYDRSTLESYMSEAKISDRILELISRPAEKTLTWGEYRAKFMTPERIELGANFWREHADMLQRISDDTGVSVEIIVGIIGVETYYGRITGSHRVIDALSTLAFEYPPRSKFFRKELREFLLLARDEGIDISSATGSYAGAMGRPQFMPSSFRAYAVDSTGDGRIDIWNNWGDVVGSIANYFVRHGWTEGEEVVAQATLGAGFQGEKPQPKNTLKPRDTVASLSQQGVMFATDLEADAKSQLLAYEKDGALEYWVGFHNFFVITRYNRSVMYALAVHQLGQEIAAEMQANAS